MPVFILCIAYKYYKISSGYTERFSLIPGKSFLVNTKNLLTDKQLPVLSGMANSLLVASGTAILSVYFRHLQRMQYMLIISDLRNWHFTFIMIIMMGAYTGIISTWIYQADE